MRLPTMLALSLVATAASASSWRHDHGPGLAGVREGDATRFAAADFDAVEFGLPGTVEVSVGPNWSVRAVGPATAFSNIRVARRDGALEIGHRIESRELDSTSERQIHFIVTLPRLRAVTLGGAGGMTVDRVAGDSLNVTLGGSGKVALGTLDVRRADISVGGSGDVTATGRATALNVNLGGSGSVRAPALRARSATVASAGSGKIQANVVGHADVSIVGAGIIELGENARCSISRMGHGTVRCGS